MATVSTALTPNEGVSQIAAGSRVTATPGCSTPETLLRALGERAGATPGITLSAGILLGSYPFRPALEAGAMRYRTWHVQNPIRDLLGKGAVEYVPLRAVDAPIHVAHETDVLLLRVSRSNRQGYFSIGPSGSYTRAALRAAKLVIAEVDHTLPRTFGETAIHRSEIDHVVESDMPTCTYESAAISEVSERIAAHIVSELPRDLTLQMGIGAIPEALVAALEHADLGRLRVVGMAADRLVDLFEAGVLAWTDVAPDPAVNAVEILGTRRILDFCDENAAVSVISSSRCHEPRWVGTLPRFVSVNSAVEVDLSGQVVSESVRGQVIAGIGGSHDFFEGAHYSAGGVRIVGLPATTPDGRISRIVAQFGPNTAVTIPRHSVDIVVTEHGVARLHGRSLTERAEAMIAIAAPQHRDELSAALS